MAQEVFHWKAGRSYTGYEAWDLTDALNEKLKQGWRIVGQMQPAVAVISATQRNDVVYNQSVLVILEKD